MDKEIIKKYIQDSQSHWEDLDAVVDAFSKIIIMPTDKEILRRMSTLSRMAGNIASGMLTAGLDADAIAEQSLRIAEKILAKIEEKYLG